MNWVALAPEILVCFTALVIIGLDLFLGDEHKANKLAFATGLGLITALGVLIGLHWGGYRGADSFAGTFLPDFLSIFLRATLLLSALLTLMLSVDYVRDRLRLAGEYYALICLATLGAMFLVSATEMLTLYLSLELLSVSSFVLVALRKDRARSAEASIKYLIFGAVSSGLLLYGFSLLFGITGSLRFTEINTFLQQFGSQYIYTNSAAKDFGLQAGHLKIELLIAILMVVGGLCYKIAAVPFHMWAPDVYEGAPLPVTAFLSASSKVAGFAALIRVLEGLYTTDTTPVWARLLIGLSVLSMTYGNVVAIAQSNLKRLFAYSSIAHAGYLLMGVVALSEPRARDMAITGLLLYLLVYVLMNLGAFAVMAKFAAQTRSTRLQDWSGLGRVHPWFGFVLACCLLSLTGLPPFAGFTGKFYLFGAVTQMGQAYVWLVLVGVLNSVISLYYYSRIIRVLFFGQSEYAEQGHSAHPALVLATVISLVGILGLFIFPNWLVNFLSQIDTLI